MSGIIPRGHQVGHANAEQHVAAGAEVLGQSGGSRIPINTIFPLPRQIMNGKALVVSMANLYLNGSKHLRELPANCVRIALCRVDQ